MVELVQMQRTRTPAAVPRYSQETDVKSAFIPVMESSVRTTELSWLKLLHYPVTALMGSPETHVMKKLNDSATQKY